MGFDAGGHNPLQQTASPLPAAANSRVLMINTATPAPGTSAPASSAPGPRRISSLSLPMELATVPEYPLPRKISVISAATTAAGSGTAAGSRKVSFVDAESGRRMGEIDVASEADLQAEIATAIERGELDFFYESETGSEARNAESQVPRRK